MSATGFKNKYTDIIVEIKGKIGIIKVRSTSRLLQWLDRAYGTNSW